jgi:hypothetical protein
MPEPAGRKHTVEYASELASWSSTRAPHAMIAEQCESVDLRDLSSTWWIVCTFSDSAVTVPLTRLGRESAAFQAVSQLGEHVSLRYPSANT